MSKKNIDECVRHSLESYFKDLDGIEPHSLYEMMMRVVEKPLLEVVMHAADQNQSKAAEWLGLNRNTLRKKLIEHKLAQGKPGNGKESDAKMPVQSALVAGKNALKKAAKKSGDKAALRNVHKSANGLANSSSK